MTPQLAMLETVGLHLNEASHKFQAAPHGDPTIRAAMARLERIEGELGRVEPWMAGLDIGTAETGR